MLTFLQIIFQELPKLLLANPALLLLVNQLKEPIQGHCKVVDPQCVQPLKELKLTQDAIAIEVKILEHLV